MKFQISLKDQDRFMYCLIVELGKRQAKWAMCERWVREPGGEITIILDNNAFISSRRVLY